MSQQQVKLFNTFTRKIEPLTPVKPGHIALYCCGPTVYDYQHIGNMRTYIFEDLLVRTLNRAGYKTTHVMNITDVGHLVSDGDQGEDKMLVAARRERKSSAEIAAYYTEVFFRDCSKLNIKTPDVICPATKHIQEMIALIQRLEAAGFAYFAGGNVYFDIKKFESYGALAGLSLESLIAGARIAVDPVKRSPHDFVLWFTKSKFENHEMLWDSPWGRGYPGWHIECSAMAMKYLGEHFDIHCGGIDHIPVHHTNEIAQSEGATGKKWVNIWMHGEFLVLNKEKMSKSTGSFLTLKSLEEKGLSPESYRYLCLGTHYRKQLNFSWEALATAASSLQSMKDRYFALKEKATDNMIPQTEMLLATKHSALFNAALFEDLNMPNALASVWATLNDDALSPSTRIAMLLDFDQVLGLNISAWQNAAVVELPPNIQQLIVARDAARAAKDWAGSDRLRAEIEGLGYKVEDSKSGTKVLRK